MKFIINLQLFANFNTNTTGQTTSGYSMAPTMKVFYDTALLENAREEMIFNQFGDKQKMHGNTVEWRKFNTFPKAMTALTEGATPDGQKFGMTAITATTNQYGDYTTISDRLEMEAYDDIIYGATEEMGAAGGATYNTLTRDVIFAGNSVWYAPKSSGTAVTSRYSTSNSLVPLDNTCLITPKLVNKAATWLKKNKAPKINGCYVALIHPSVAEDLRESTEWKEFHKYNDVQPIFKGEIGMLHGVRFIENNECPVWKPAGASIATYGTLFLGAKAYGILEPDGESMEMIIKGREEIGGPLELYSTIGYKFCHGARILYQERILRLESASSYSSTDTANSTTLENGAA